VEVEEREGCGEGVRAEAEERQGGLRRGMEKKAKEGDWGLRRGIEGWGGEWRAEGRGGGMRWEREGWGAGAHVLEVVLIRVGKNLSFLYI
jgi:hypothetical protein